ncbi:negative regulator of DNA transposition-like protein [Zymoseptoria brevis]|uniref:Negative regulator of DNA transposition-like protein n=1 Tax=Zymoseptoria brevis TaxID=1047168 RepID=A0A0F4GHR5_9PEZI|nr:negative regulator of DNA transposition-like protein [Zymoseptoria brevis]
MASSWSQDVQNAFPSNTDLAARIIDVAQRHQGELPALFGDIAKHILSSTPAAPSASKKRKLDESSQAPAQNGTSTGISNPVISFECKNVSFAVPARKKLKLQLVTDNADANRKEVRVLNQQTNDVEYSISNTQIEQAFCLPVPEKQQRQWNFVIFPQNGAATADGMPCEQMVFTLNETKPDDASSASRALIEGDTYVSVTEPEMNQLLQPLGKRVVKPTEAEFSSSIPQSHRKGEKAYHVKSHRGTKEGYLFFLSNGIVFGFKKPLSFFPFSVIESISYTSVLQRTFNLVITSTEGDGAETQDTEFSMIDQADFGGIDEYVKRHGLNDASLAANRRAKAYNVNKTKAEVNGDAGGAENGGEGEESELAKAEQALQDAEDEEEEDYEASGGESEGEYSEEDDEDGEEYGDEVDEEGGDEVEHDEDALEE